MGFSDANFLTWEFNTPAISQYSTQSKLQSLVSAQWL